MLCGESRAWRRNAWPAPAVSLPEERPMEAWASRWAGKPLRPTPVTGRSRHIAPAALHMA